MIRSLTVKVAATAFLVASPQVRFASAAEAAPSSPQVRQMRANGVDLAYVEQGSGVPVIFVHGAVGDWRTFDGVRPAVAARYRYVAYSRRYHYPNPWPGDGSDYSYQLHEQDLVAFIRALNAGPVHLVGTSYGAAVVLLAVLDHPELVKSAVIGEPGSLFPDLITGQPSASALLEKRAEEGREMRAAANAGDMERATELLAASVTGDPNAFQKLPEERRRRLLDNARTMGPMLAQRPPPRISCARIAAIRVPVLALRGERTTPFYAMTTDALYRCLSAGNREVMIPNAGHVSYAANPAAYIEAVMAFLALHP
jgi:pimeloyl-ACP methyl ester carboxylesterase